MPRKAMRDVVVLMPGITGSVLAKDGKELWAPTGATVLRTLLGLGRNVEDLLLEEDQPDADELGDGITAPRVMPDIHPIPGFWKIDGYGKVAEWIKTTFDVQPGRNFFEFAYDWRRDNRVAARQLERATKRWLAAWRERSGHEGAKLVLVGHSMGGLVARYFLECLDGWRTTRALVTFGTPYRGAVKAVGVLANGLEKKLGPFSLDLSAVVRSLTSAYQLLPIYPCYDDGSGKLVRVTEASIRNVDPPRAAAARAFHDEIRRAVEEHEKDDEYLRGRCAIRPVVGTFQPTAQSARVAGDAVEILRAYRRDDLGGDGTVPRVSATPLELEREENAMFTAERHASLQNDDAVLIQLGGVLSGLDLDLAAFRQVFPMVGLALDVEDAFLAGEPMTVRAAPRPTWRGRCRRSSSTSKAASRSRARRSRLPTATGRRPRSGRSRKGPTGLPSSGRGSWSR